MSLTTLVLLAGATAMSHGVAPVGSGLVVAAPHEGFDDETKPMAKGIAKELGWGWVVAENYRAPQEGRWLDVNRPTQRWPGADGRLAKGKQTRLGRKVYAGYQRLLLQAGKRVEAGRLDLLVEIHGHARQAPGVGKVQVIELATRGFSEHELRELDRRYRRLVRELPKADRVTLAAEQLHPSYDYAGQTFGFYFRASVAKKLGSLSPARTRRALHFELPQKVRLDPDRREAYTRLLAKLLAPLR